MTSHQRKTPTTVSKILEWFAKSARDLPWRRTVDPYAIWVSEIMLQQTQVKTVIPYWERWMKVLPTVEALAAAKSEVIHKLWEGLGYYTRVRNMQKAAKEIMANHQGQFPRSHEAILALPGIGRYTAGAISSIAFNEPRPILDGNVIRVLTRLFGVAENPREKSANAKLWRLAEELVMAAAQAGDMRLEQTEGAPLTGRLLKKPFTRRRRGDEAHISSAFNGEVRASSPRLLLVQQAAAATYSKVPSANPASCSHLNQSLMELGALICTPKQPRCLLCPVREHCAAYRTGRVDQLPNLGPRTAPTSRRFIAFVIEDRGRFLVRQRPAGVLNAHLWEFPNVEIATGESQIANCKLQKRNNPPPHPLRQSVSAASVGGYGASAMLTDAVKAFAQNVLGLSITNLEQFCVIKHSITRYRITLEAFCARIKNLKGKSAAGGRWARLDELDSLAFTGAHRKVLKYLVAKLMRKDRGY